MLLPICHLLAQDSGWGRMDPGLGRAGPFGSRLGLKVSSQPPFWAHQLAISLFLHPLQAKVPGTCLLTIRVLQAHGLPSKDLGVNCSLLCSSIHGIFQARVLEWVAIAFSRGSS